MGLLDILLLALVLGAAVAALVTHFRRGGGCHDCENCPARRDCASHTRRHRTKKGAKKPRKQAHATSG